MKRFFRFIIYYFFGLGSLLLISCIPALIGSDGTLNLNKYFNTIYKTATILVNPDKWFIKTNLGFAQSSEVSLLDFFADGYIYSMQILFGSLFVGLMLATLFAFTTFLFPSFFKTLVKKIVNSIESFPDILFIFMIQLFIVFIYKQTGIVLFEFVYLSEEKIFLAPIIALSIVPTVLFLKLILLLLEEEWQKNYIELARSKGLSTIFILFFHALRNIRLSLFYQSKHIVWTTLSSLLIIETFFQIHGIIEHVLHDRRPYVILFAMAFIYTPFYFIYNMRELLANERDDKLDSGDTILFKAFKKRRGEIWSIRKTLTPIKNSVHLKWNRNFVTSFLSLLKKPKFFLGFIYVTGFTLVSFIFSNILEKKVKKYGLFDEYGNLLGAPPHPPSDVLLIGSDYYGFSVGQQMIVGAKYTIILTVVIALLRVFLGYIFAYFYVFFLNHIWKKRLIKFTDGIHFIPLNLVALVILHPILWGIGGEWEIPFMGRLVFEALILILLVLPIMMSVIGNEISDIGESEFIQSAIILGANRTTIFFRHLTPAVFPRLLLLVQQQVTQVAFIFIHLGFFRLFVGGTFVNQDDIMSITYEWSGMVSAAKHAFIQGKYWIITPPLISFVLLIWSVQAMAQEMINLQQRKIGIYEQKINFFKRFKKRNEHGNK